MNYSEYLESGTKRIEEFCISQGVGDEEKNLIVNAFSNELSEKIGNPENLIDYDQLIYSNSIRFIDNRLSHILSQDSLSETELREGIGLCQRLNAYIPLYKDNKWELPKLANNNPNKCQDLLEKRLDNASTRGKIIAKDQRISELLGKLQNDPNLPILEELSVVVEEFEQEIAEVKKKRQNLPIIVNKDVRKLQKQLSEIKKKAVQREELCKNILSIDNQIHSVVSSSNQGSAQWRSVISLCQKQIALFNDCSKMQWTLPQVKYDNPEYLANKYQLYITMAIEDEAITKGWDGLHIKRQYTDFFDHCDKLQEYIQVCNRNRWELPRLTNSDPRRLKELKLAEKDKGDRRKRFKIRLLFALLLIVAIGIAAIVGVAKYRSTRVKIPFDASSISGRDLESVSKELVEAGFENIHYVEDESGWFKDETVIGVSIDNSDGYKEGSYIKPDVEVIVDYSSKDRIFVTSLLENWEKLQYSEIEKVLTDAGFNNIVLQEIITSQPEQDNKIAGLDLNDSAFTNEECYLPKDAPIIISYYSHQIGIGSNSSSFIGRNYGDVVKELQNNGFKNVISRSVKSGWAKSNTVVGVSVDNNQDFNASTYFQPDARIVVIYSSDNRIEVTDYLNNWNSKNYSSVVKELKKAGLTYVNAASVETTEKNKNGKISSITIDTKKYENGECYLMKDSVVRLKYYELWIQIGKKAADYKNAEYQEIVKELETKGFTNITLKRANNIGWFFIHPKEGTIKSISINGNDEFEDYDTYKYDTNIVIVVNTRTNEGCEDITTVDE